MGDPVELPEELVETAAKALCPDGAHWEALSEIYLDDAREALRAVSAAGWVPRAEHERMYQRALDAESHAQFGPMDVDERVRALRALVDATERERDEARAELEPIESLLGAEGLLREPDDEEQVWYRPDLSGVPQPEVTEYGTTGEAVRRVLDEVRASEAMAYGEVQKVHGERDVLRDAGDRLAEALGYYADEANYNEEGAPTYENIGPPDGWLGEEFEARTELDLGKLARQRLAEWEKLTREESECSD